MLNPRQLKVLKSFNWNNIFSDALACDALNEAQNRFLKGRIIEKSVEWNSNGHLTYIGDKHKDFDWIGEKFEVEMKSVTSFRIYGKKGQIKEKFEILLSSVMGNKKQKPIESEICDLILILYRDGAFVLEKENVLKNIQSYEDGLRVRGHTSCLIPLTGLIQEENIVKNPKFLNFSLELNKLIESGIKDSHAGVYHNGLV